MPEVSQVHIDATLTNLSVAYRNPAFIADELAPVVNVKKQFDRYFIYDSAPPTTGAPRAPRPMKSISRCPRTAIRLTTTP